MITDQPSEFDAIAEIQENDKENANEYILDQEIKEAEKRLNAFKSQERKLKEDFDIYQQRLENEKSNNEIINQSIKSPKAPASQFNDQGSFFVQLRHIEAKIERWENTKETLIESVNHYEGEFSRIRAQNHRLRKKVEELEDQYQNSQSLEISKKGELKTLNNELFKADKELSALKDTVEESKMKIKAKAEEIKTISPNDAMALKTQKVFLEKEVEERKAVLEELQNNERSFNIKFEVNKAQSKKRMEKSSLTSNWMSERNVLLSKLKNIRKELKSLATRERGTMKSVERNQKLSETINFDDDEIKLALIAERSKIPTEISSFLLDAMKVEKDYHEKLQNKLKQIGQAEEVIKNFKTSTTDVLKLTEENAEQPIRMSLLLNELHELRKEVMK